MLAVGAAAAVEEAAEEAVGEVVVLAVDGVRHAPPEMTLNISNLSPLVSLLGTIATAPYLPFLRKRTRLFTMSK